MTFKSFFIIALALTLMPSPNGGEFSWSETKKLTWADFKGKPDINSDAVALTASGITFGYSYRQQRDTGEIISFTTDVNAYFYPNMSWYHKDRANNYILAHEQLHFDLTELYVRKFRKAVKDIPITKTIKSDLKKLQKDINSALSEAQNKYDFETNHSIIPEAQQRWIDSIHIELEKHKEFKSQ